MSQEREKKVKTSEVSAAGYSRFGSERVNTQLQLIWVDRLTRKKQTNVDALVISDANKTIDLVTYEKRKSTLM